MPILGADMEDGTLVEWRIAIGEQVHRGDVIAEVETDKGLTEVEAFVDGVLEKILVEPGTKVAVGTPLALIRESGAPAAAAEKPAVAAPAPAPAPARAGSEERAAPPAPPPPSPPTVAAPPGVAAAPAPPAPSGAHLRSSPAARRRAAELAVDLARVHGTGPGGAIQVADVERAAREPSAEGGAPAPSAAPAMSRNRMRDTIASVMARAKREIPHYYLGTTIDLEETVRWIARHNADKPPAERLLPGVALLKATALALREVPELNGVWGEHGLELRPAIHVGVAIALRGGGLIAPALHDTDRKPLDQLMRELRDLVQRARAGSTRSSELSDPTVTVTNLGDQGVESVFAVIYPPQVAIVGFGRIVERPWVVDKEIVARHVVTASLSADHRASDGHRGARFLAALDRLLQNPEAL